MKATEAVSSYPSSSSSTIKYMYRVACPGGSKAVIYSCKGNKKHLPPCTAPWRQSSFLTPIRLFRERALLPSCGTPSFLLMERTRSLAGKQAFHPVESATNSPSCGGIGKTSPYTTGRRWAEALKGRRTSPEHKANLKRVIPRSQRRDGI